MASGLYLKGLEQQGLGNINFESDTMKLYPMATSYTPNYSTDQFVSDISASIASGASAITLSSVTYNIDSGNLRVELDSANPSDSSVSFTSDKFVIADTQSGVDSTSPLICCIEHTQVQPVNGTYSVTVNAEGYFSIASA